MLNHLYYDEKDEDVVAPPNANAKQYLINGELKVEKKKLLQVQKRGKSNLDR